MMVFQGVMVSALLMVLIYWLGVSLFGYNVGCFRFYPHQFASPSSHNIYYHPNLPSLDLSTMSKVTMHGSSFEHYNTDPSVPSGPGFSGVSYFFLRFLYLYLTLVYRIFIHSISPSIIVLIVRASLNGYLL